MILKILWHCFSWCMHIDKTAQEQKQKLRDIIRNSMEAANPAPEPTPTNDKDSVPTETDTKE